MQKNNNTEIMISSLELSEMLHLEHDIAVKIINTLIESIEFDENMDVIFSDVVAFKVDGKFVDGYMLNDLATYFIISNYESERSDKMAQWIKNQFDQAKKSNNRNDDKLFIDFCNRYGAGDE